jgi:hypothetical protein
VTLAHECEIEVAQPAARKSQEKLTIRTRRNWSRATLFINHFIFLGTLMREASWGGGHAERNQIFLRCRTQLFGFVRSRSQFL